MNRLRLSCHPRLTGAAAIIGALLVASTAPALAQYGGTPSLFVDPVQVPVDGSFDAVGFDCPGASVVTITIDGVPGSLATTVAEDDNSYVADDVAMPEGLVAGSRYDVRASCAGGTATFEIIAACSDGSLPVDGACDGQTTGVTTTTTNPSSSSTSTPTSTPTSSTSTTEPVGGGTNGTGGTGGTSGSGGNNSGGTNLAVTGASFVEQVAQIGVTLIAVGGIVLLLATRRRDAEPT